MRWPGSRCRWPWGWHQCTRISFPILVSVFLAIPLPSSQLAQQQPPRHQHLQPEGRASTTLPIKNQRHRALRPVEAVVVGHRVGAVHRGVPRVIDSRAWTLSKTTSTRILRRKTSAARVRALCEPPRRWESQCRRACARTRGQPNPRQSTAII